MPLLQILSGYDSSVAAAFACSQNMCARCTHVLAIEATQYILEEHPHLIERVLKYAASFDSHTAGLAVPIGRKHMMQVLPPRCTAAGCLGPLRTLLAVGVCLQHCFLAGIPCARNFINRHMSHCMASGLTRSLLAISAILLRSLGLQPATPIKQCNSDVKVHFLQV